MTDQRPKASEVKMEYLKLCKSAPGNLAFAEAMRKLANTPGLLEALAAERNLDLTDFRKALAGLGRFLELVGEWAGPSSGQAAKTRDKALQTEPQQSDEIGADDVARVAREARYDDLTVLARCRSVKVHVDGASKGNPGPAGVGVVVTDLEGETLYETCRYIGKTTNGVAEYKGLITALQLLVDNGAPEVFVFSDSEFMVKQMQGFYKVRTPAIVPLIQEAQKLRRQLPKFQIIHVPRGKNQRADELANLAVRQARDASVM